MTAHFCPVHLESRLISAERGVIRHRWVDAPNLHNAEFQVLKNIHFVVSHLCLDMYSEAHRQIKFPSWGNCGLPHYVMDRGWRMSGCVTLEISPLNAVRICRSPTVLQLVLQTTSGALRIWHLTFSTVKRSITA